MAIAEIWARFTVHEHDCPDPAGLECPHCSPQPVLVNAAFRAPERADVREGIARARRAAYAEVARRLGR